MPPEVILGLAIVVALVFYILSGGADFGGGVWDLLASGPRRAEQRALIERAIGPIWEANHVWLVLAVVVLFTGFPRAFAALSIAFHVPLTLLLLGIVFRGSSFAFRTFAAPATPHRDGWGLVFSIASVIAPVLLGVVVGAAASGQVELSGGRVTSGFFAPWLGAFPFVVGGFSLALCALLAASYLACEAENPGLADDFRARGLAALAVSAALGTLALGLAARGAPLILQGLVGRWWSAPLLLGTAGLGAGMAWALWRRRYRLARGLAIAATTTVLVGWVAAQFPYLLVDDLTLAQAAAGPRTLRLLTLVLALGVPVLGPSLYLLFRVFKRAPRGPVS